MKKNNIILQVENINQTFTNGKENKQVLKDVSFSIEKGEILCIIGESGCGKSTLLRIIAGFLPATSGKVIVNGHLASKPTKSRSGLLKDNGYR